MAPNSPALPATHHLLACCSLAVSLTLPLAVQAENGAVGYARPASDIVIDGNLSDWPENATRYPIESGLWDDGSGWRDEAYFQAAYDPSGEYLYLSVEVTDDSTVNLPEEEADLLREDTLVIYIDAEHHWRGSAPWAFVGALEGIDNISNGEGWDPQTTRATDDSADLAVVTTEEGRRYEWRIELDQVVRAGMSIGLDLILVDVDEPALNQAPAYIAWGPYGSKAARASRLGDLVLLDATEVLGTLSGDMAWADGIDGPDLGEYRVRVRNRHDPELWVSVISDETGRFSVDLPSGEYCITPAFILYGPEAEFRLTDDSKVCDSVQAGEETVAATLVKSVRPVPEHHIQESGLLFSFDGRAAERLDAFMADYMDHYTIPGAGVAIIKDGEIVYRQEYGVTNWLTQQPVRRKNLFDIGSITKVIFAFAVHRLVERGVLELDRPLYEYLPFEDIAHDERSKLFTARLVLSHQTGLPNWRFQNDDGLLDIEFTPGEGYRYSGEGYDYLGRVVEHLTGESLETVMMREAVEPLGMSTAVRFTERDDWHDMFVHGHSELRAFTSQTPDEAHAAYSAMASASDLAQVLLTWMERGGGLSDEGYDAMFEQQVDTGQTPQDTDWKAYYGVGPRIVETPYGRAIGHGGLNWGQIAQMEFYEDHNAGFVMTTNGDDGMHVRNALRLFLVAGKEYSVGNDPESE
ncbi:MAG: serine hydrolase [Pseudomonadota bacterium]